MEYELDLEFDYIEMIQENGHYDRIRESTRRNRQARVIRIRNRVRQRQEELERQFDQLEGQQRMSYDSNSSLDRALELAKKRAMQFSYLDGEEDGGNPTAKRHLGAGPEIHLKLLIPSSVAGHVIGKGGETIAELRRTSGTNIMMSKNNEMFPGTQDRVSLISGSRDAISDVVQLLVKKM